MENRLGYQFPSGFKKEKPKRKFPVNETIIFLLSILLVLSLIKGDSDLKKERLHSEIERSELINELDRFYYDFCHDAKTNGWEKLPTYQRVCTIRYE